MVSEDIPPTLTQQGELIVYFERVSTSLPTEWYALLRGTQGRPELYSDELKYMLDGSGMDYEWRYILNLDSLTVEIDHGSRRMSIPFGEFVDMDFDDLREDND